MGKCSILVIFSLPKSGVDKMNQYTPGYMYYRYGYVTLRQKRTHDVALKIYEWYHSFVVSIQYQQSVFDSGPVYMCLYSLGR